MKWKTSVKDRQENQGTSILGDRADELLDGPGLN